MPEPAFTLPGIRVHLPRNRCSRSPESVFTMLWNGCSPSAGICVHDAPEYAAPRVRRDDESASIGQPIESVDLHIVVGHPLRVLSGQADANGHDEDRPVHPPQERILAGGVEASDSTSSSSFWPIPNAETRTPPQGHPTTEARQRRGLSRPAQPAPSRSRWLEYAIQGRIQSPTLSSQPRLQPSLEGLVKVECDHLPSTV